MLRLHHVQTLESNTLVELSPEASHHLVQVMRVKIDSEFRIFNQSGEFIAHLKTLRGKIAVAKIGQKIETNTESNCKLTLLQAVTRRERMDYSIQKATELGVNIIQPVMTQHCVVKLDSKKSQKRLHHWQGIAQHAAEQSGRLIIPTIKPVLKWTEAIDTLANENYLKLIFALAASKPLHAIENQATRICLAIGPVGGFSESEVNSAINKNFQAIKLGPRILRSETATTAALTAIQMRWGDLN